ncbi:hypothetical protein DFP72DRAFT_972165 [Ephemerocybe angulata]|uniref:Uncharacterized protein n=1 Tax=Ephemerocybe angulata TaxID=980116 RepID=A0A8H6HJF4_9AGAR|nr:hypothetical protein DFP72DRAFT_972165 [Tulosesus angulatus]
MQRFLECLELKTLVCDDLDRKSAYALALTNSAFLHPGLKKVWQTIDTFEPLLRCLPADVLSETKLRAFFTRMPTVAMSLRRPLVAEDLARYRSHARYIREFKIDMYRCKRLPAADLLHGLELVTEKQHGALAPNLRSFKAFPRIPLKTDLLQSLSPFTYLFMGTRIEQLEVRLSAELPLDAALIQSTSQSVPNLKALNFSADSDLPLTTKYLSSSTWDNLQSFCARTCSSISILASLPQLRTLRLTEVQNTDIQIQSTLLDQDTLEVRNRGFPSLREMEVHARSFTIILEFIRHLPTSNTIRTLTFGTFLSPASPPEIQDILSSIRARVNPLTLESLQIADNELDEVHQQAFWAPGPDIEPPEPEDLGYDEPIDALPHTHDFTNLEVLVLRFNERIRVTSGDLAAIPGRWPRLTRFEISETGPKPQHPLVDHTDLMALVEHCPSLRVLGVPFDTTRISGEERSPQGPFLLSRLYVIGSPICSPSCVAEFLQGNFPELEQIELAFDDPRLNYSDSKTINRWVKVRELVIPHWEPEGYSVPS